MRRQIEERSVALGKYIVRTGATVRETARAFGISKSAVHKDVHDRLSLLHPGLYAEVREILDYHHAVRHLRGGAATRRRWRQIRGEAPSGFSRPS
ncbi:MAG: sporulation transcriptional regulator SpoIIID [Clostridiales bacterium]|nr:sporulation transcriptional regulator SpoIIID [Clostridiales bacterium]